MTELTKKYFEIGKLLAEKQKASISENSALSVSEQLKIINSQLIQGVKK